MKRPTRVRREASGAEVDSLRRGFDILRCFSSGEKALNLVELANRSRTPRSTTQKLVATLTAHRFLRYLPELDRYEPDVSCFVIGQALRSSLPFLRIARPLMASLARSLDVEVLAAVREGNDILLLECCAAREDAPHHRAGTIMPLAASALGRAWLWSQRPAVQAEHLERLRGEGDEMRGRAAAAVYRAFEELERVGYCVSSGDVIHDFHVVATPLALEGTPEVVVLGCATGGPGDKEQFLRERVALALLETAARIRNEMNNLQGD